MNGMQEVLVCFAIKYEGDFNKIYRALQTRERMDFEERKELLNQINSKYVTIVDNEYPNEFKMRECPPFVMFYEGNLELIDQELPIKQFNVGSNARIYNTIKPIATDNGVTLDYLLGCENQNELKPMLEHMKSKQIMFKNNEHKNKDLER